MQSPPHLNSQKLFNLFVPSYPPKTNIESPSTAPTWQNLCPGCPSPLPPPDALPPTRVQPQLTQIVHTRPRAPSKNIHTATSSERKRAEERSDELESRSASCTPTTIPPPFFVPLLFPPPPPSSPPPMHNINMTIPRHGPHPFRHNHTPQPHSTSSPQNHNNERHSNASSHHAPRKRTYSYHTSRTYSCT